MICACFVQRLTPPLAWLEPLDLRWTPLPQTSPARGSARDLTRSKSARVLENALLRQPLAIRPRHSKKPRVTRRHRLARLRLAGRRKFWKQAFVILQPDTLLRRQRQGFRLFGRLKRRARPGHPRLSPELVALIPQRVAEHPFWGAERIRGELLQLGMRMAQDTLPTDRPRVRPLGSPSQDWNTFRKHQGKEGWTCVFLPLIDLVCRTLDVFFIVAIGSRRGVHCGIMRHPNDARAAQQRREATPSGQALCFLIRDDGTFGGEFAKVAKASSMEVRRTPYRAPRAHTLGERFLGRVRCEGLDNRLTLGDGQWYRVLKEYGVFCNGARPHPGMDQKIPERRGLSGYPSTERRT